MITGLDAKTAHQITEVNRCARCGSRLIDPYGGYYGYPDQFIVLCAQNIEHEGFKKIRQTKTLSDGKEYDIMTQRPVDETPAPLALPQTLGAMQLRVREAIAGGLLSSDSFSSNLTPPQQLMVAKVALAYGLDPLLEELAILHGKPYPTIKAKRRKHAEAGHQPGLTFRGLEEWEVKLYREAGDLKEGDLAMVGIMTRENGLSVEHFGKVTRAERDEPNRQGDSYAHPVVRANPIEMVQKRCESGCWEKAYGPLGLPKLFEEMILAAAQGEVVEGQILSDTTIPWCIEHDMAHHRNVSTRDGHVWYSHRQADAPRGYCNASDEQNRRWEGLAPQAPNPGQGQANGADDGGPSEPEDGAVDAPFTEQAPPAPGGLTNNTVLDFAKKQGYRTNQVPQILGNKQTPVTLPQFLEAGHSLEDALEKVRQYTIMDKGQVVE